jgi:hypothetical protein
MRTKIRLLASALCLLFVQLSPNLAHAGKSSGGGNDDAAFVLQEAMSLMPPGLPMEQRLLKLFEDSATRIPEVRVVGQEQGVEFGELIPAKATKSYVFYFNSSDSSLQVNSEGDFAAKARFDLSRKIQDRGPLDDERGKRFPWKADAGLGSYFRQTPSSTGFVLSSEDFGSIEFRQYTPELILFVLYPSPKTRNCINNQQYTQGSRPFCGVGYFY